MSALDRPIQFVSFFLAPARPDVPLVNVPMDEAAAPEEAFGA
jgi:hypothetical protein